jgi:exodeoxyribonuclease V gamma subunit
MIVHRSNRIEALVDALAEVVARPLADPFAPEWIAVQGRGMERWLSMELARRLGIWANPAFPFPRAVIQRVSDGVLGVPAENATPVFDPDTLVWAIAAALPDCLSRAAFAPVRAYLGDDPSHGKCLSLAARIAELFDQYAVYRPDLVLAWEGGAERDWQAELWRALVRTHGAGHAAARARALLAALAAGRPVGESVPRRISLFGLSTLPPLYVRVLAVLPAAVELHLFQLSPSREYWGELRSRRASIRALVRGAGETAAAEGHPLLAALGGVGREFQQVLEENADYQDAVADRYVDPGTGCMLAALQSDILALRMRGDGPEQEGQLPLIDRDHSIAVHVCHGPMREVEVLHDQLVALFEGDATLEPQHVIVMTPSIDAFAPVIEAVFGGIGRPSIPFRIADRSARARHTVVDAFVRTLELMRSRLPASAVVDLLSLDPVRMRFDIAADQLPQVRRWVVEAGIRWGADGSQRGEHGQPECDDNTWRFGLDRLLLGYAIPAGPLFEGVAPVDSCEGSDAALLGRFGEFCDVLSRGRSALRDPRTPVAWRDTLRALLAALIIETPANAFEHLRIGAALDRLADRAARAGFAAAIGLDAVRPLLERELARDVSPHGFLSGAVTFCELVPMRSIPFRVVCLLGLDDGAFPRIRRPLAFDRMATRPLPGDRSAREDDCYLFLEALLAARDHLLITYVGQSISDDAPLPASVVVDELLDVVDQSFVDPAGGRPRDRIVHRHPLQPFSPRYFGADPALFSYATTHYAGAVALVGEPVDPPPWLAEPLPPVAIEAADIDDLVRFFDNPTRWFLQQRLGVYLGRDAELLEDREPIELDALDRWQIGDALLRGALTDGVLDLAATWPVERASGRLPLGMPGRDAFDEIAPIADALARAAAQFRAGERLDPERIDVAVDDTRVTGVLRDLWPGGQIAAQYSRVEGRYELRLWIRHLARAAAGGRRASSLLIGRGRKDDGPAQIRFRPVDDPLANLRTLLHLFRAGHHAPLPFFAGASRAFVDALRGTGGGAERALDAAHKAFAASDHGRGDSNDPYVAEIYPNGLPLVALAAREYKFADVADAVLTPLLVHREEVK